MMIELSVVADANILSTNFLLLPFYLCLFTFLEQLTGRRFALLHLLFLLQ